MSIWRYVLMAAGIVLSGIPLALYASASDVVPARTGGFGEMTCQQCHWENPLNEPAGRLMLDGIPETYTPGEQYLITVTLARPGIGRAGFQLSAREDAMAMNAGSDAGVLAPIDESLQIVQNDAKRVTYIQHTRKGTTPSEPDVKKWRLQWTAPDTRVPVVFHVAGNASNDDASPLGDFIYTAIAHSR
jgi:hypothetical protein